MGVCKIRGHWGEAWNGGGEAQAGGCNGGYPGMGGLKWEGPWEIPRNRRLQ